MMIFYALVVVLCISGSTTADIISWGACPDVQGMPDFNINNITGTWYAARMYFKMNLLFVKCVKTEISQGENGTLLLDGYGTVRMTGKTGVIRGIEIRTLNESDPSNLEIKFPFHERVTHGLVLGTDYDSFFIGYRCRNMKLVNLKSLTIATREQHPSEAVIAKAIEVIKRQNLNTEFLLPANQENCETGQNSTLIQNVEEVESFY